MQEETMDAHSSSSTHRVVFVNDRGQAIAVPGKLVVKQGDLIEFHSVDVGRVTLVFPKGILIAKDGRAPVCEYHLDQHAAVTFIVQVDEKRSPGMFSYAAYCHGLDDVALGGSQPKIIIYE
jgi:hypothetical protein